MSKEKVLNNVQKALEKNSIKNEKGTYKDIIIPVESDILKEYKRGQENNKAVIYECDKGDISEKINEILAKENIGEVLVPESLKDIDIKADKMVYNVPVDEIREKLFNIECGIFEADYGISNLGVLSLTSSADQPRLLSLITRCSIILLKKENIEKNMATALKSIKDKSNGVLPSNILFIAGPSRTADIEFKVVLGVHGPQVVYIILY